MKIYISSPITGTSDYRARFDKAADKIRQLGYEPINPCDLDKILNPKTTSWEQYMIADIGLMKACDAVCFVGDWERSKGCRAEYQTAKELGMKIYKGVDSIPNAVTWR